MSHEVRIPGEYPVLENEPAATAPRGPSLERIERIYTVTEALARAITPDQIFQTILLHISEAVDAASCSIVLLAENKADLDLVAAIGVPAEMLEAWRTFPLDSDVPVAEATRTGTPIFIETLAELVERYPGLAERSPNDLRASWATVPMIVSDRTIGAIGLGFVGPRRMSDEDRSFILTLAHQCALAVERSRLFDAERQAHLRAEDARARLAFMAEASAILVSSLDYEETIRSIARLAVPVIAELCSVELCDEEGAPEQVALAHVGMEETGAGSASRRPDRRSNPGRSFVTEVIRSGRTVVVDPVTRDDLEVLARDAGQLRLTAEPGAIAVVPLSASGATLGCLVLAASRPGRFDPDNVALAEGLAHRAAQAVENARLYRQAERARMDAEYANRVKDQFLAALSHELRTPLTPVLASVQVLELDEDLPESAREILEIIRRNVELEARIVDDLLDLTRITRGEITMNKRIVDLHEVIHRVLAICDGELREKKIGLRIELFARRHHVWADESRIQQVIWNLVKNAVKFTPENGLVRVGTADGDGIVRIDVADSGVGIEPTYLERIFDAFDQGDLAIGRRFGGLGVGLAICRMLVDMHHGRLTAASDGPGTGACFAVELATVEPAGTGGADSATPRRDRQLNVLLVEDHADSALVVKMLLQREGLHVDVAESVGRAMDLYERGAFDLLISDIGLPDGTGHELIERLRLAGPVKGIALTGFGMEEDVRRSREAGFAEHLTKPVNHRDLRAAIDRLIR